MSTCSTPAERTRLASPDERPGSDVVLYDGNCRFCVRQVRQLAWWDCQGKLSYLSLHDPRVAERYPDLGHEQLMREMVIVDRYGGRHAGADAIRYVTRRLRRLWWAAPILHFPLTRPLWRFLYRMVARYRYRLMGKMEDCGDGACSLHGRK